MKKLIAIIITIAMIAGTAPNASALRPMANKHNNYPSLEEALNRTTLLDLSPRLNMDSNMARLIGGVGTRGFLWAAVALARGRGKVTATEMKLRAMDKQAAGRLLQLVSSSKAEGLFIDPEAGIEDLENFLNGDRHGLYTRIDIEDGKKILIIRPYILIENAIAIVERRGWEELKEDGATIFLEGLDIERDDLRCKCVDTLSNKLLSNRVPEAVIKVFERTFKLNPDDGHRFLLARHILNSNICPILGSDERKNAILAERLVKLEKVEQRDTFRKILPLKMPADGESPLDLIMNSSDYKLISQAADGICAISKLGDEVLSMFYVFFGCTNKAARQEMILHELSPDELRAMQKEVEEDGTAYPYYWHRFYWEKSTIQLPQCGPRVAAFGDTGKYRITEVGGSETYEMNLEKLVNIMQMCILLADLNKLETRTVQRESIFSHFSPKLLKAAGDLFFIEAIGYETGGKKEFNFNTMSDTLLKFYFGLNTGFYFDLAQLGISEDDFRVDQDYGLSDPSNEYIGPSDFLSWHNIALTGGLTTAGRNIYGWTTNGKRVVIKVDIKNTMGKLYQEVLLLQAIERNRAKLGLECGYPVIISSKSNGGPSLFYMHNTGPLTNEPGHHGYFLQPQYGIRYRGGAACYITDQDCFVYLDDHKQEYYPEPYLRRSVRDLTRLARCGVFLEGWASYAHTMDTNNWDWTHVEGAANMPQFLRHNWYTNHRKMGPTDLEHTFIKKQFAAFDYIEKGRRALGDIMLSAVITEAVNMWKHHDYPYKFFYEDERKRFTEFLRGVYIDFYKTYTGTDNADMLDNLIDWSTLSDRLMYEVGSVIRQELSNNGTAEHYDLGYDHGPFPCPELIRATYITTTLAMIEKSVRDKAKRDGIRLPKAEPDASLNPAIFQEAA